MINVSGENDASEETIFQSIDFISTDVSDGSEDGAIAFRTRGAGTLTERLRISEQGFLKFPNKYALTGTGDAGIGHHTNNYMYIYGGSAGLIHQDNAYGSNRILIRDSNSIEFEVNGSQRAQINSSGNVLFGKTADDLTVVGCQANSNGALLATRDDNTPMHVNRLTSNGALIAFYQDSTLEGYINVSGTSVTLVGFSGAHESSGISSDTAIGTVCSTIDELDTYVSGTKEGQTRADR